MQSVYLITQAALVRMQSDHVITQARPVKIVLLCLALHTRTPAFFLVHMVRFHEFVHGFGRCRTTACRAARQMINTDAPV